MELLDAPARPVAEFSVHLRRKRPGVKGLKSCAYVVSVYKLDGAEGYAVFAFDAEAPKFEPVEMWAWHPSCRFEPVEMHLGGMRFGGSDVWVGGRVDGLGSAVFEGCVRVMGRKWRD